MSETMSELIDGEQIRVLADAAGKEMVTPILDAFWQSNDELMAQLDDAIVTGDAGAAAKVAHALKGSASNLGANAVAETSKRIEHAAKANDLETARGAAADLPAQIAGSKVAFDALIATV